MEEEGVWLAPHVEERAEDVDDDGPDAPSAILLPKDAPQAQTEFPDPRPRAGLEQFEGIGTDLKSAR